jgi:hypothetical protein
MLSDNESERMLGFAVLAAFVVFAFIMTGWFFSG